MLFQSIKTTSNRTFFCTILSEASWGTLLKIFTSEMLSQEYSDSNEQDCFPLQCCLEPLGQHAQIFYLFNVVPRALRQLRTGFFPVQCCLETLGQNCKSFYLSNIVPSVWGQHWTEYFLCNVVWRLLDNIEQDFFRCNVVQRVLRQYLTGFLPVQCCLEVLGQHSTKFLLVQYGPKIIRTTLNKIFACAMLSGGSWTT